MLGELGVLTPWKYVGWVRVCFDPPPKMSHSFIQNCCWITQQVSYHQGRKTCVKMKCETNFSRRPQARREPGLLSVWKSLMWGVIWNSLIAWPDWPWHIITPMLFLRQIYETAMGAWFHDGVTVTTLLLLTVFPLILCCKCSELTFEWVVKFEISPSLDVSWVFASTVPTAAVLKLRFLSSSFNKHHNDDEFIDWEFEVCEFWNFLQFTNFCEFQNCQF